MTIKDARQTMWKKFEEDSDFANTYKAQISCFIMDNFPGYVRNKEKRDKLAEKLFLQLYKDELDTYVYSRSH